MFKQQSVVMIGIMAGWRKVGEWITVDLRYVYRYWYRSIFAMIRPKVRIDLSYSKYVRYCTNCAPRVECSMSMMRYRK